MALTDPVSAYTSAMAPVGGTAWTPVFEQLASWLTDNATIPSLGLVAPPSGGTVTGAAAVIAPVDDASMLVLGRNIARAVLEVGGLAEPTLSLAVEDAAPKWAGFAKAVVTTICLPGQVMPGTMNATNTPVSPGVVSGKGIWVPAAGPAALTLLAVANIPVTDTVGQVTWLIPAAQIVLWLTAAAEVVTGAIPAVAPPGGGPVVGVFNLS